MNRLNFILLAALVGSSLYLVSVSYEGRRLYAQLDAERNKAAELQAEWKRLDAERQDQAKTLRVEQRAKAELKMRASNPAVTQVVVDAEPTGVAR